MEKLNFQSTLELNNGVRIPREALGVFQVEDSVAEKSVRCALKNGYRHIDTATIYGNEAGVGRGIRESGVPREEIFLTTKLWNDDMRALRVKEAFEQSLEKLGTDYVDLYLIHWPVDGVYVQCWKAMEELYEQGRVRAIGVSNFQTRHLDALLKEARIVPAVNQIERHPLLTQLPLRAYCQARNIAIEAWSPLGGTGGNLLANEELGRIAKKYGKTVAQLVLRWDLQQDVVILPKSVHEERIIQNTDLYDFEISPEDMEKINALNQNLRTGADPDTFDF
jgi:diketogulonate reductase-like aldo/keto reductase